MSEKAISQPSRFRLSLHKASDIRVSEALRFHGEATFVSKVPLSFMLRNSMFSQSVQKSGASVPLVVVVFSPPVVVVVVSPPVVVVLSPPVVVVAGIVMMIGDVAPFWQETRLSAKHNAATKIPSEPNVILFFLILFPLPIKIHEWRRP